jgi:hypothetical protein
MPELRWVLLVFQLGLLCFAAWLLGAALWLQRQKKFWNQYFKIPVDDALARRDANEANYRLKIADLLMPMIDFNNPLDWIRNWNWVPPTKEELGIHVITESKSSAN